MSGRQSIFVEFTTQPTPEITSKNLIEMKDESTKYYIENRDINGEMALAIIFSPRSFSRAVLTEEQHGQFLLIVQAASAKFESLTHGSPEMVKLTQMVHDSTLKGHCE